MRVFGFYLFIFSLNVIVALNYAKREKDLLGLLSISL